MTPAESLARRAHAGQVDKAGQPYVGHLERVVANLLRRWPDATEDEVAAAWLHDVVEDCAGGSRLLLFAEGISNRTVSLIYGVTRSRQLPYRTWISDLAAYGSLSAIRIKLADLEDNMDPARVAAIPDGASLVERRYRLAVRMLEQRLEEKRP